MRRAVAALRLLPQALSTSAPVTFVASCTAPQQWSHHLAGLSSRGSQIAPAFGSEPSPPRRGFAADCTAQSADAVQSAIAEKALRNFPSLGRAALPGRGRGNVNAAMEVAPEQFTVLTTPISERYPKVSPCMWEDSRTDSLLPSTLQPRLNPERLCWR